MITFAALPLGFAGAQSFVVHCSSLAPGAFACPLLTFLLLLLLVDPLAPARLQLPSVVQLAPPAAVAALAAGAGRALLAAGFLQAAAAGAAATGCLTGRAAASTTNNSNVGDSMRDSK